MKGVETFVIGQKVRFKESFLKLHHEEGSGVRKWNERPFMVVTDVYDLRGYQHVKLDLGAEYDGVWTATAITALPDAPIGDNFHNHEELFTL